MSTTVSITGYRDYKLYLRDLIRSKDAHRGLQTQMARAMGCQAAYLYQVLNGKVHLTDDHAFGLAKFLELSTLEWEYLSTLLRLARVSAPDLIKNLEKKLDELRELSLDISTKADSSLAEPEDTLWDQYLSHALPSLVHVLTSSSRYQSVPTLASRLKISEHDALTQLKWLESFGLVKRDGSRWSHSGKSIHFGRASRHNLMLQAMRRSQALSALFNSSEKDIQFSTLFTLDQESYAELREITVKFIEKAQKRIHAGGTDEMYLFCLDLFSPRA